jgi:hypothetical protein
LVGFGVSGPIGSGGLVGTAFSNDSGFATIEFRMPSLPESFGTWTVFSNSQVADIIVWDFLTFEVVSVPPRSPKADFIEIPHEAFAHEQIYFDASSSEPGFDGDDESPIVEYRWDFGDGNQTITTIPIIYHAYSNAGVYYVTLTVFAPGIPSFIDPQYIDTNITYPPQRKLIHGSPVGGYSHPFESSAETNLVAHVLVPAEMLAITFVVLGRKRTRTKLQALKSRFCHF